MAKKKFRLPRENRLSVSRARQVRFLTIATFSLIAAVSLATIVGPWKDSRGARKLRSLVVGPSVPAGITPPPRVPSKEYVYVGGRLVATEDPNPGGNLAAPMGLSASTSSSSRIDIGWTPTDGADHYEIERRPDIDSAWTTLSSNVVSASYSDTAVSGVKAYLYRVRAVDSLGNTSAYSNLDIATAITFTDDPLVSSSTVINSDHILQLRDAINAVRATAKLPSFNWTDNLATLSGITVKATHVQELRTALDEGLNALGLPVPPYSDSGTTGLKGVPIKKTHIDELRQRAR